LGGHRGKIISGLADAIVEVTETGSTIRAHGLKIIHDLMQSNTQVIANREAWRIAGKRKKSNRSFCCCKEPYGLKRWWVSR